MRWLLAVAVVICACGDSQPLASVSPLPSDSPTSAPSLLPSPVPGDPCHVAGVTYCALSPAVTEASITKTICVVGWTNTVRPSTSYTTPLKLRQLRAEHLPGSPSLYEEDHRVPLELGGSPKDPQNLSPELNSRATGKDGAENEAKRQVCAGEDLRTVQFAFITRWLGPYPTYR